MEDISFVREMKVLRKLNLSYTKIDDDDLDNIVALPLKELLIANTNISLKGLSKLNKITSIERLTLSLGNGISRSSIKQVLSIPNCIVDIQKTKRFQPKKDNRK